MQNMTKRRVAYKNDIPFLLLALSPIVIFDSDYALISCPLCKSNTVWDISVILGRNRTRQRVAYKNDNSCFLTFRVICLYFNFEILISCPLYNSDVGKVPQDLYIVFTLK